MKDPKVLVSILGGVIFRWYHETSTLSRSTIHSLNDVDHFLFVLERPIDFVVVSGAQIDHDVFVAKEEHNSAGIVQFVPVEGTLKSRFMWKVEIDLHFVKVWNSRDVDQEENSKVFHFLSNTEENFIHLHAGRVPIVTKSDDLWSDW